MKFTKQTLNAMLDRIIDEYFSSKNKHTIWQVISYVKGLYADEIDTLEEGEKQ